MKLRYLYGIMILFLLLSCKKEELQLDYRHGWVGKYECKLSSFSSINPSYITTKNTIIDIHIVKDSCLEFTEEGVDKYEGLFHDTIKISTNGKFTYSKAISIDIDGKFIKDSLYIHSASHSPGASSYKNYKGKQIKNN